MPIFQSLLNRFRASAPVANAGPAREAGAAPDGELETFQSALTRGDLASAKTIADRLGSLFPRDLNVRTAQAMLLLERGDAAAAVHAFEILARDPARTAHTVSNAIEALRRTGQAERAVALADEGAAQWPDDPDIVLHRSLALRETGEIELSLALAREALRLRPAWPRGHANLLFALSRHWPVEDEAMFAEHRAWGKLHADPLPRLGHGGHSRDPDKVLEIAYLSADFRSHSVAWFTAQLIERHDRSRVRVTAYFNGRHADALTARIERAADRFVRTSAMSDEQLADAIRADGIDVLVDLSGHTRGNRLLALARHPAPVQITWVGYLFSTGMQAMDWRLTDAVADPPGIAERFHTERLLRLPRTQWCYEPPEGTPAVSVLPALQNGAITFGAVSDYNKLNPHLMRVWARLLREVPGSRLIVLGIPAASASDWVYEAMEAEQIALDRVILRGRVPLERYFASYADIDIALDTFPCNGGTTTCEALWMGVPVVSQAGSHGARRAGASLLDAVGLGHLAATNEDDYVNRAATLAGDTAGLAALRAELRTRMQASPLMDGAGFARDMEAAYRDAWRQWTAPR